MAVYYKFKSAKDFDTVAIDGPFIMVGHLKEKIFELKHLGRGTDFDLVVTNAQTDEEYVDDETLIPKNTSVIIRRVPGRPRKPIVTEPVAEKEEPILENNTDVHTLKGSFSGAEPSMAKYGDDLDWDEFGNDLYAIPETVPVHSSVPVQEAPPVSKEDEDSMIKALIDTPALDWQHQPSDGFGSGRGFGRGGRMMVGRGFGRGGFEKRTPPEGYICHRCKVPGHFIHHCPTNGDPTYDIKRVKPPTGIPKSMLMATPDGSYALPSGANAVLKPNEAAFEKEIEGMPSTRSVGELPPELHCPVCKEVMKDAVLTSKCCFTSFCDKCIRDHIISKSMCVCGATNILADDLLPNKTLRDTINRILESGNSSEENGRKMFQVQDTESRNPQAKVPSPTHSAASKGQQVPAQPPQEKETSHIAEAVEENKLTNAVQQPENGGNTRAPDVLEVAQNSRGAKEEAPRGSAQLVDEEVQHKPISGEAGKKKKKKKLRTPPGAEEMSWRTAQDFAPENCMMPLGPSAFNPYWNGVQPGFDGFMPPYPGPMPYMGYGFGPMDVPFGGVLPPDPFGGLGHMLPCGPPQRDLAELAMGYNPRPPIMSREEFEARKAGLQRKREMELQRKREMELQRKREIERHGERDFSKDREYAREMSSRMDVSPMKSKSNKPVTRQSSAEPTRHRSDRQSSPDRRSRDPEPRSRDPDLPRPSSKRKSDYDYIEEDDNIRHHRRREYRDDEHRHHRGSSHHVRPDSSPDPPAAADNKQQKVSVFSRISFPERDAVLKRRKMSSSEVVATTGGSSSQRSAAVSNGYHEEHKGTRRSGAVDIDEDSSDDERHFKRRRSRHASSPAPVEEEPRQSRGLRDRERDRDRGHSKHR